VTQFEDVGELNAALDREASTKVVSVKFCNLVAG
jgi:hypothetical protein